jgi:hypothetical protein
MTYFTILTGIIIVGIGTLGITGLLYTYIYSRISFPYS